MTTGTPTADYQQPGRDAAVAHVDGSATRVTLHVPSDRGNCYLYDDVTGNLLPWSDACEAVLGADLAGSLERELGALEAAFGAERIEGARRFVRHWRTHYGAFVRPHRPAHDAARPSADQIRDHIRNASMQLLLVVTESCNLRCRYCVYSGQYQLQRQHTARYMTADTAIRAVDWYANLVQPQVGRSPEKKFGLTFYGGEPLLHLSLIKQVMSYARERYPGLFAPVMTTNGTLLSASTAAFLVEHNVQLAVSIDGPAVEHDRRRVDTRGEGTHARIVENLREIKRTYPSFWATNLSSVCVYDWRTDLEASAQFFDAHADVIPRPIFVNAVSARNTTYYDSFTAEDRARFLERLEWLRARYKSEKVQGDHVGGYLSSLVGFRVIRSLLRHRLADRRNAMLPYTGTCVPGDKIAVSPDGTLRVCERVNGTWSIGHLNRGGLDYEHIGAVIDDYRRAVCRSCARCPVSKLCNVCFAFVDGDGRMQEPPKLCADVVNGTRSALGDYVSILEQNPQADFSFETDVSLLEKRMLFLY